MVTRTVFGLLVVGLLAAALASCHPFESLDDPFANVIDDLDTSNSDGTTNVDAVDGAVSDGGDGGAADGSGDLPEVEDPCSGILCGPAEQCIVDSTLEGRCVPIPCEVACPPDMLCVNGGCECKPGKADCDNKLDTGCETSLSNDPEHCGGCWTRCIEGQLCLEGVCDCPAKCPNEQGLPICVDLQSDVSNCGACGQVCDHNQFCFDGQCKCLDSLSECTEQCVNLRTDPNHCGGCEVTCSTGQACCGGGCVDLLSDVENCGTCGNLCPSYLKASASCAEGLCGTDCDEGYADCDVVPGCEVYLLDPSSCGVSCLALADCGSGDCRSVPGGRGCTCDGQTACTTGTCVGTECSCGSVLCATAELCCDDGFGYQCSAKNSMDSCGACGNICPNNQVCVAGVCSNCTFGHDACDGICAVLLNDTSNCGSCGNICSTNQSCVGGQCF